MNQRQVPALLCVTNRAVEHLGGRRHHGEPACAPDAAKLAVEHAVAAEAGDVYRMGFVDAEHAANDGASSLATCAAARFRNQLGSRVVTVPEMSVATRHGFGPLRSGAGTVPAMSSLSFEIREERGRTLSDVPGTVVWG